MVCPAFTILCLGFTANLNEPKGVKIRNFFKSDKYSMTPTLNRIRQNLLVKFVRYKLCNLARISILKFSIVVYTMHRVTLKRVTRIVRLLRASQ